jgi:hypothetical protein
MEEEEEKKKKDEERRRRRRRRLKKYSRMLSFHIEGNHDDASNRHVRKVDGSSSEGPFVVFFSFQFYNTSVFLTDYSKNPQYDI